MVGLWRSLKTCFLVVGPPVFSLKKFISRFLNVHSLWHPLLGGMMIGGMRFAKSD